MAPGRRRALAVLGAALALVAAGLALAYAAASPLADDDGKAVRVGKLGAKRLFFQGMALALALRPGGGPRVGPSGDPRQLREDPTHPYFQRVRSDPRTRRFYTGAPADLPEFAAMADFVRDRVKHGIPEAGDHFLNVLEALDRGEDGARFACGHVSRMLIQLVQAGGGIGRPVQLDGHVVAELWSRRHARWIAVDADYDVYFTDRAGQPLAAWEIHTRVRDGRRDDLVPHVGGSAWALYRERPEALYDAYREGLAVLYYARWISQPLPRWHPGRSPVMTALAYYPDVDLERWLHYRTLVRDPAQLYAPPVASPD